MGLNVQAVLSGTPEPPENLENKTSTHQQCPSGTAQDTTHGFTRQSSIVGEPLGSAAPLKPTYRIHTLPAKLLSDLPRQLVRVPTSPENISETGSNLQAVLSGTPKDPENIAQNVLLGTSQNPENV